MNEIGRYLALVSLQTAIFALVIWAVTSLIRRSPASWRLTLWILVLIKFLIPPFAGLPSDLLFWVVNRPAQISTQERPRFVTPNTVTDCQPQALKGLNISMSFPSVETKVEDNERLLSLLGTIWLVGMIWNLIVLFRRYRAQARILSRSIEADTAILEIARESAATIGVARVPRLRLSDAIPTPALMGLFVPAVVLPSDILERCSPEELRAMLLHEFAHLRRRDMLFLWLYHFTKAVCFFHPAIWLAGHAMRRERELACDDTVIRVTGIPRADYARGYMAALKMAAQTPLRPVSLSMAEPMQLEKKRMTNILDGPILKITGILAAILVASVLTCSITFGHLSLGKTGSASLCEGRLISLGKVLLRYSEANGGRLPDAPGDGWALKTCGYLDSVPVLFCPNDLKAISDYQRLSREAAGGSLDRVLVYILKQNGRRATDYEMPSSIAGKRLSDLDEHAVILQEVGPGHDGRWLRVHKDLSLSFTRTRPIPETVNEQAYDFQPIHSIVQRNTNQLQPEEMHYSLEKPICWTDGNVRVWVKGLARLRAGEGKERKDCLGVYIQAELLNHEWSFAKSGSMRGVGEMIADGHISDELPYDEACKYDDIALRKADRLWRCDGVSVQGVPNYSRLRFSGNYADTSTLSYYALFEMPNEKPQRFQRLEVDLVYERRKNTVVLGPFPIEQLYSGIDIGDGNHMIALSKCAAVQKRSTYAFPVTPVSNDCDNYRVPLGTLTSGGPAQTVRCALTGTLTGHLQEFAMIVRDADGHCIPMNHYTNLDTDTNSRGTGYLGFDIEFKGDCKAIPALVPVTVVDPDSPAGRAGMKVGDRIVSAETLSASGEKMTMKPCDLLHWLNRAEPGSAVRVRVLRSGRVLAISMIAAQDPMLRITEPMKRSPARRFADLGVDTDQMTVLSFVSDETPKSFVPCTWELDFDKILFSDMDREQALQEAWMNSPGPTVSGGFPLINPAISHAVFHDIPVPIDFWKHDTHGTGRRQN